MTFRAYFDGGSRGNPGISGAGGLLLDQDGQVLWERSEFLGLGTNNEAEYKGAIMVIEEAFRRGIREIELLGDSRLVICQLSGQWRIKEPRLRALAERFWEISKSFKITYRWIPREGNSRCDDLANRAMDRGENP